MIKRFNNFQEKIIIPNIITKEKYPLVRHLSSFESAICILENEFIMSRNEMKRNIDQIDPAVIERKSIDSNNKWCDERRELENNKFGTEDLIFCIPDWYNNSGYETGHGPVMIYFKPSIFEDFKVTLTIEDSLTETHKKVYNNNEMQKIYSNILNENSNSEYKYEAKKILENLNHKNKRDVFQTSKGPMLIEGDRFYNKYAEIQIHTTKIPIEYIQEIRFTDNYLDVKKTDRKKKDKIILMAKDKKMKVNTDDIQNKSFNTL